MSTATPAPLARSNFWNKVPLSFSAWILFDKTQPLAAATDFYPVLSALNNAGKGYVLALRGGAGLSFQIRTDAGVFEVVPQAARHLAAWLEPPQAPAQALVLQRRCSASLHFGCLCDRGPDHDDANRRARGAGDHPSDRCAFLPQWQRAWVRSTSATRPSWARCPCCGHGHDRGHDCDRRDHGRRARYAHRGRHVRRAHRAARGHDQIGRAHV